MKPPKCKTCGAEEWKHLCGGLPQMAKGARAIAAVMISEVHDAHARIIEEVPVLEDVVKLQDSIECPPRKRGRPKTTTPEQRKEYLAKKARDRRAGTK